VLSVHLLEQGSLRSQGAQCLWRAVRAGLQYLFHSRGTESGAGATEGAEYGRRAGVTAHAQVDKRSPTGWPSEGTQRLVHCRSSVSVPFSCCKARDALNQKFAKEPKDHVRSGSVVITAYD